MSGRFSVLIVDFAERLASYGLVALVSAYTHATTNPWRSTQRMFTALYHHMGTARENLKETVVVAVGSMGK